MATPRFSRATYDTVAAVLRTQRAQYSDPAFGQIVNATLDATALEFAAIFATDNAAFKRDKFLDASGVAKPPTRGKK